MSRAPQAGRADPTWCACWSTRRTPSPTAAASTTGSNFTLSMGCGTWGGNSITDNLNYKHFLNITHLVTTIPEDKPSEEELFGALLGEVRASKGRCDELRGTRGEIADSGAGRHCRCRAACCARAPTRRRMAAAQIGPCVVKAQVPTGKRGKAGGIKLANTPAEAEQAAGQILGMTHRRLHGRARAGRGAGQDRARVLCRRAARHRRAQAADPVLDRRRHGHRGDRRRKAATRSAACWSTSTARRRAADIAAMLDGPRSRRRARRRSPRSSRSFTPPTGRATPSCWRSIRWRCSADGRVVALDCKFVLDDAAIYRQPEIAAGGAAGAMTDAGKARRRGRASS